MLIIKLLEGIIRLTRGVPFSVSRHSLDSGLFGALGLCGGSTRRQNRRPRGVSDARNSRVYSETTRSNTSPISYRQAQANISYLKPEQASIPYRESSDDDHGFIMESWSKTDLNLPVGGARSRSKLALEERSITDESSPSTGFTRVGGGRAHFDTPYAIAKGKQSMSRGRTSMSPPPPPLNPNQQPPVTPRPTKALESLSKGAARPFHSRTRSQTAVIEDASTLAPLVTALKGGTSSRPGSAGNVPGAASRPPSSGKSASHHSHGQRPGSSGKSPRRSFNSRPPSGTALPRPPSRDMPPRQPLPMPDEMGAMSQSKSASTSKGIRRRWFGLGGSSAVDSSSDEEEEEEKEEGHSRDSSGKKHENRWKIKRRRKSESDVEAPPGSPPVPERSFVVVRNRPLNLGPLPTTQPAEVFERNEGSHRSYGVDPLGSPLFDPSNMPVSMGLVSRTPSSPPEVHDPPRAQSPPSSYNLPRTSRRMSSPAS